MSTFTDDLAHVRDQLRAARHLLHSGAPVPAVRAAAARLDDALPALEAVIDQLDELQITALSGPARRVARDLVAQPNGATPAQVMTATGRSQAWVIRVLKTWVDAGVVTPAQRRPLRRGQEPAVNAAAAGPAYVRRNRAVVDFRSCSSESQAETWGRRRAAVLRQQERPNR